VNGELFRLAPPHARFMHCLPAHRGEEVTDDVLDSDRSVVFQQAENRMHAQKALLEWLLKESGVAMAQAFPPRIRGTQLGLKNPALVDQLKAAMRAGQFHFHEIRAQVGGVRDRKGVYHVVDGHHRIVAAWEIWLNDRARLCSAA